MDWKHILRDVLDKSLNELAAYFGLKAGMVASSREDMPPIEMQRAILKEEGVKLLPEVLPGIEISHFAVNDNYRRHAGSNSLYQNSDSVLLASESQYKDCKIHVINRPSIGLLQPEILNIESKPVCTSISFTVSLIELKATPFSHALCIMRRTRRPAEEI